jgi:TRAP-type C4-dicarboxylate transport system permease large subunit
MQPVFARESLMNRHSVAQQNALASNQASAGHDGAGIARAIVIASAIFAVVVTGSAVALWAHYGTTVFFEMIKSGIAACM